MLTCFELGDIWKHISDNFWGEFDALPKQSNQFMLSCFDLGGIIKSINGYVEDCSKRHWPG